MTALVQGYTVGEGPGWDLSPSLVAGGEFLALRSLALSVVVSILGPRSLALSVGVSILGPRG